MNHQKPLSTYPSLETPYLGLIRALLGRVLNGNDPDQKLACTDEIAARNLLEPSIHQLPRSHRAVLSNYFCLSGIARVLPTMDEVGASQDSPIGGQRVGVMLNSALYDLYWFLFPPLWKVEEDQKAVELARKTEEELTSKRTRLRDAGFTEAQVLPLIVDLGFSTQTLNTLKRARVPLLAELAQFTASDLMQIRRMGRVTLKDLRGALDRYGFSDAVLDIDIYCAGKGW